MARRTSSATSVGWFEETVERVISSARSRVRSIESRSRRISGGGCARRSKGSQARSIWLRIRCCCETTMGTSLDWLMARTPEPSQSRGRRASPRPRTIGRSESIRRIRPSISRFWASYWAICARYWARVASGICAAAAGAGVGAAAGAGEGACAGAEAIRDAPPRLMPLPPRRRRPELSIVDGCGGGSSRSGGRSAAASGESSATDASASVSSSTVGAARFSGIVATSLGVAAIATGSSWDGSSSPPWSAIHTAPPPAIIVSRSTAAPRRMKSPRLGRWATGCASGVTPRATDHAWGVSGCGPWGIGAVLPGCPGAAV